MRRMGPVARWILGPSLILISLITLESVVIASPGAQGVDTRWDTESVDPLTGSVRLTIPLYNVNQSDHFSLRLSLVYNNDVWDSGDYNFPSQPGSSHRSLFGVGPFGIGWKLPLGTVSENGYKNSAGVWEYYYYFEDLSGARHRLFQNTQGGSCVTPPWYAYDGSGVKAVNNGDDTWTAWTIDGTRYSLTNARTTFLTTYARIRLWRATSIESAVPKSNGTAKPSLTITYNPIRRDCPQTITDDFGRVVSVSCDANHWSGAFYPDGYVYNIDVPGPHGTTLRYGLGTTSETISDPLDCDGPFPACAQASDVLVLNTISARDTANPATVLRQYAFGYDTLSYNFGELRSVTLPSGGQRFYSYGTYRVWRDDIPISFEGQTILQFGYLPVRGIIAKELRVDGTHWHWDYLRSNAANCTESTPQNCYNHPTFVEIRGPYDTADPSKASSTLLEYHATLASQETPAPLDGSLISAKVYAGSPDPSRLLRTTTYEYGYDVPQAGTCGLDGTFSKNHYADNVRSTRADTIIEDDAFLPKDKKRVDFANWVMLTPNFGRFQEQREYLPDGETLYRTRQTGLQLTSAQLANWVLTPVLWTRLLDAAGQALKETDFEFDEHGRISQVRRLYSPGAQAGAHDPNDLVSLVSYDDLSTGNMCRVVLLIPAQNGSLPAHGCSSPQTTGFVKRIVSWDVGYPTETRADGVAWAGESVDRDFNTGLPTSVRSPWGGGVSIIYDALGRSMGMTPLLGSGDPPVTIEHTAIGVIYTGSIVRIGDPQSQESIQTREIWDGLGRVKEERRLKYDDTGNDQWVFRTFERDAMGNILVESEWRVLGTPDVPATIQERHGSYGGIVAFDPFLRVRKAIRPDGSVQTKDYQGLVTISTIQGVQTGSADAPTIANAVTTTETDIFGRTIKTTPATNEAAELTMLYDELDRRRENRSDETQPRTWDYDALGRVTVANEPERGKRWFGSHTGDDVQPDGYNALGVPIRAQDAAGFATVPSYHYLWTYDTAGRLTTYEKETEGGSPVRTKISELLYDLADHGVAVGAGHSSHARLARSIGYDDSGNPLTQTDYYFTETYGRLTRESTAFDLWDGVVGNLGQAGSNDVPHDTHFGYDSLGLVSALTYPTTGGPGGFASTHLTLERKHGLINWIGSNRAYQMVANALYEDSGTLKRWVAGNDLKTEVVADDDINSRVKEIKVVDSSGNSLWTTGDHAYDGAGFVSAIGNDVFTYDLAGRLKEARISGATGSPVYRDFLSYDVYGNLDGKSRSIDAGMPAGDNYQVDPLTNRIVSVNQGPQWAYREDGALTSDGDLNYAYDNAARLAQIQLSGTEIGAYMYGASGLRVYRRENHGKEVFYFRDAQGNVLSQFSRPVGTLLQPVWDRDFVYLGGLRIAMIEEPLPSAVSWMQSSSPGSGISMEWYVNPETDLHGYLIFRKDPGQGLFTPLYTGSSSITTTATTYLDTSVVAGSTYVYKVVAVDAAGNQGAESVERQITFGDTSAPTPPINLAATPGNAKVTLSWLPPSPSVPDLAGYNVYRKLAAGTYGAPLNGLPVTATNYIDLSVTNGTTYYYVVKAVDTAGMISDPSNEVSAKPTSKQMGFKWLHELEDGGGEFRLADVGDDVGRFSIAPYAMAGQSVSEKIFFLHSDHLGSIRLVTDTQATVVTRHKYASYGEELQPAASANPYKYAGYERDSESLMDYVKARFYMPEVGRWTRPDPLGDGYVYAVNSPLSYLDPSGLNSVLHWTCYQVCSDDGFGTKTCDFRRCDPNTFYDDLEYATYNPVVGPLPPPPIQPIGGDTPVMNPPPPPPIEPERECGYIDGTASVVVGPGAYHGAVAGIQKNPNGDMFLVVGRTFGADAGTNLLFSGVGGPMLSVTESLPGQRTGGGAFVGVQVTVFGLTAQLTGSITNWRPSWALEIGLNSSLLGGNIQGGVVAPIGQGAPLAGCR